MVIAPHELLYIEYFPGTPPAVTLLQERFQALEVTGCSLESVQEPGLYSWPSSWGARRRCER
jgi:hypothetical protein